ncbi:putative flavonol 7-O-beta-glucosyltransferase [Medicago truncatula]|uniref:Glycosyltransferase n=1 Tax=Medicago truncatula TaxID=3880 RepID=G7L4X3_MEDTR|nr:UDP-glycosyltransferase 73C5 [Medicago truncatula]AES81940.1 UDP-glucosyltransferase family protein [Medicago truncatula]RHN48566.1 putative flavonol 7-O-beta-glucosyltransferase [Medicago truncatula]
MASQTNQQHFLLIPLMSQSHLIPFTEMAKLFASNGVTVTIVLTPLNAARFNMVIDQAKSSNLKIQFQLLPFPCVEAGLPKGCENMDTLPSPKYQPLFFAACNMLKEPLENWLSGLEKLPSCIVSDICLPWTSNVASKFNIPRVVFHAISCFTLLCSHNISLSKVHEKVDSMSTPFVVPDLPDTIEFTKAQLPEVMKQDSKAWKGAIDQFKESELSAQGILVNTFEELEKVYVRGYEKVAKKVWCIGPLSLHDRLTFNKFGKDDKGFIDDSETKCLKFLISNKACSVIYACFGSLSFIPTSQLKELALGLEASNHPFIWVIGKNDCSIELEKWLKEENFEERTKGKGVIVKGWAPQVEILSHPSTGGFLSHCGWNSTMEAISSGVPMITWPMFAEQFFNEKLIVQVLKIGVRIGVEAFVDPMEIYKGEKVLVKKEDVKRAIENLMENGVEGEQRRNKAKEIKDMAYKAVEDGGSSDSNCKLFIQEKL